MNMDRIARRVACRELANQYAGLISQDMDTLNDDSLCGVFWAELVRSGPLAEMLKWTPVSTTPPSEPMSDAESKRFGAQAMTFGKHLHETVDNVPREYLAWLADQPDEFKESVRRYLRSDRVKNEIEHEGTQ